MTASFPSFASLTAPSAAAGSFFDSPSPGVYPGGSLRIGEVADGVADSLKILAGVPRDPGRVADDDARPFENDGSRRGDMTRWGTGDTVLSLEAIAVRVAAEAAGAGPADPILSSLLPGRVSRPHSEPTPPAFALSAVPCFRARLAVPKFLTMFVEARQALTLAKEER